VILLRGAVRPQADEFVAFTAILDLGQVFNLWHSDGAGSFMTPHH
jgi:hypothetical protein